MGSPGGPVGLPGEVLANGLEGVRPEAFRKSYTDPGGLIGMAGHCSRMRWSVGAVCSCNKAFVARKLAAKSTPLILVCFSSLVYNDYW